MKYVKKTEDNSFVTCPYPVHVNIASDCPAPEYEVVETDDIPEEHKESMLNMFIRPMRDKLLADCDVWSLSDFPGTEEQKIARLAYRQALRDLPENIDLNSLGFISDAVWPEKPE